MQIKEQKGFQILPKRWVVERTFAWLNGSRRLSKDYETSCCSAAGIWLPAILHVSAEEHH